MAKPRILAFPAFLALSFAAAACSDDAVALETDTGEEVGSEVGTSSTSSSAASSSGEESGETGTTGHPDPEGLEPIRGLQIAGVTANQGTAVAIANGTNWNGGNDRSAPLVGQRTTLIRGWWTLDADWVPREVHCRLELFLDNGESRDYWAVVDNVSGDTQPSNLNSSCNFLLDGEDAETGAETTFQLSVWEPVGNGAGLTAHPVQTPATGPELVGFEASKMEMDILFVPIEYQGEVPPIEENLDVMYNALYQQDPLQKLFVDVREEPVPLQNPTLNAINATLDQLRVIDEAPWNRYYFGFVRTGQQGGTVGLAGLGGIVASGIWRNSVQGNAETMVHEVGHNLGMNHVECPVGFGMPPYAAYPYANGLIGVPGYGILDGELYNPGSYYNYMTYCGPTWVSDWNFNTAWPRIYSATNDPPPIPEFPPPLPPDEPMPDWLPTGSIPVLRGVLGGDGYEEWWTTVDVVDPELLSGTQKFRFEQEGLLVAEMLGEVRVMPDGQSLWVSVPLVREVDLDLATITRSSAGQDFEVYLAPEKQLHHLVFERLGINSRAP